MPTTFETVPNQKAVIIHREMPQRDFIAIKKSNFAEAYQHLGATALVLYLHLVGNQDGYSFALSPTAIHNQIGMPSSTVRDQINRLIALRYLVCRGNSNIYDFYEHPQPEDKSIETPATHSTATYSAPKSANRKRDGFVF